MHQNVTNITLKNILTKSLELGCNYAIEKPTKLYVQELIIDTENATGQLETKILIAVANNKVAPLKNSNRTNIFN
jgi:putative IMPACT (imprinted ancient) family translation regulator